MQPPFILLSGMGKKSASETKGPATKKKKATGRLAAAMLGKKKKALAGAAPAPVATDKGKAKRKPPPRPAAGAKKPYEARPATQLSKRALEYFKLAAGFPRMNDTGRVAVAELYAATLAGLAYLCHEHLRGAKRAHLTEDVARQALEGGRGLMILGRTKVSYKDRLLAHRKLRAAQAAKSAAAAASATVTEATA